MSQNEEGRLTTHVLDTSLGQPAAGLAVTLFAIDLDGQRTPLVTAETNADGRCDSPLLAGEAFVPGRYEIVFAAGPYLAATMPAGGAAPFFDDIAVRFSATARRHYHVPLLLSPYGYSTYRGS
ncbi:hydroxyisourate hydrolase [Aureimonas glaciei]|uniref:5-hydroxyisourate hydrolase n=1 Tax=Aureimonas glaciei TaxID=1776957 RepID=A0A917DHY6_9HYPH|nr:hydroxyisourate hydrolase [Aureimonas glaciei]GGD36772.1 5-hydroxyisourate hydrolase [Aureimonas glaciei]